MKKLMTIIITLGLLVIIGYFAYIYVIPQFSKENRQISGWIHKNSLNKYGDQENTVYSNGSPCNNPHECYNYIKEMHPDKPWEK